MTEMHGGHDRQLRYGRAWLTGLAILLLLLTIALGACGSTAKQATVNPASAPTFVHTRVSNVTWCWSCHPDVYGRWRASTSYTSAAYGALRGHNVNIIQTLTDSEHNTGELLINDCVQCHSPFGARHQDGVTATKIGELVTPVNQTGHPVGSWSLVAPYTVLSTSPAGFYLPADHPTDLTHAAWEGISCRVCHDTSHLTALPDGSRVPTLAFFNPGAATNANLTAYAYTPVPTAGAGRPNVTWLCDQCHQPNGDDTRNPQTVSVHAGLSCIDCHGQVNKSAGQPFNHDLNAGQAGAPISQTSCARCHSGAQAVNSGHPDVTKLATSLVNHALYVADPAGDLQVNAVKWHNIHFITCDTCHQPAVSRTNYSVVYGSSLTIAGKLPNHDLGKLAPNADGTSVNLWTVPNGKKDGAQVATSAAGAAGSGFVLTGYRPAASGQLLVTQALPIKPDPDHSVLTMTFPGMGRGVLVNVTVRARVDLKASATRAAAHATVQLSGTVGPSEAGHKVTIQMSAGGGAWTNVTTLSLSTSSAFTTAWKAPATGRYSLRAVFGGSTSLGSGQSAVVVVTVS